MSVARLLDRFFGTYEATADGNHAVELRGVPFSLRVILDPRELIRLFNKHQIKKAAHDVNLTLGPVNNILGQYHMGTGQLDVDVMEIALAKVKDGDPDALDREVTGVIAHEFRHACQREKHSMFAMKWDQVLMFVLIKLAAIALILAPGAISSIKLILTGTVLKILLGFVCAFGVWILFRLFWVFAGIIAYRFSWHERDARAFERVAKDDPDWRNLVHVEVTAPVSEQEIMVRAMLQKLVGNMRAGLDPLAP